ncbi:hypothetical protein B9Z19DRAFT_1068941 [Tuber borchii]|uniref:Uncharacterized protein n=1 Tax=Tuber borchii TaxID=42251 RepID=A0A2T6ZDC9_TUBBO|nr:hypothetical protein B9Z19DRAFT_1068941 [Tuber borchii]
MLGFEESDTDGEGEVPGDMDKEQKIWRYEVQKCGSGGGMGSTSRATPIKGFRLRQLLPWTNSTELIFHSIPGRENLDDTVVKTAEAANMLRHRIGSLDFSASYGWAIPPQEMLH